MRQVRKTSPPPPSHLPVPAVCESPFRYAVSRYKQGRHWAVHAPDGSLVCVALYRKGAKEVVRRLNAADADGKEGNRHAHG